MAAGYAAYNCHARDLVIHAVELVPTFSFSSCSQAVLADFEEMARLTVSEKNMVLPVLDLFQQGKQIKSLINMGNDV